MDENNKIIIKKIVNIKQLWNISLTFFSLFWLNKIDISVLAAEFILKFNIDNVEGTDVKKIQIPKLLSPYKNIIKGGKKNWINMSEELNDICEIKFFMILSSSFFEKFLKKEFIIFISLFISISIF